MDRINIEAFIGQEQANIGMKRDDKDLSLLKFLTTLDFKKLIAIVMWSIVIRLSL